MVSNETFFNITVKELHCIYHLKLETKHIMGMSLLICVSLYIASKHKWAINCNLVFSDNNSYFVECYVFWLLYKPTALTINFLVNCVLWLCI